MYLLLLLKRFSGKYSILLILLFFFNARVIFGEPQQKIEVGFEEKLGAIIPLDLKFFDEYGQTVTLSSLVNKPTILNLVYFRCAGLCSPLMNGIADVIDRLDMQPGKDYQVITISFDPTDDYLRAIEKKKNYFESMQKKIPEESWRFLTGDSANISRITNAVGFRYIRQGQDFIHSAGIMTVSPKGKISRYLYGTDFLPFDVKLALTEASEGKSTPTIAKIVKLCYSYDPEGRKYVLNITRIAGGGILVLIIAFVAFVTMKKKKTNIKKI
ncbi:MAG: SCO family protein [Ignavibacteria bacterium]|jgi:protein SCO1/2